MPDYDGEYVFLTTHEFKNNIARWTRLLERGTYKVLFIKRHGTVVAAYLTDGAASMAEKIMKKRARREGLISEIPRNSGFF